MKKDRDNWLSLAPDAIIGYCTLILGIVCFLIALGVIAALVRLVIGMGAA
ncbi:MAG: hypothetical protein J6D25_03115 [Eggerthellaceae bacterium]|nr:hypothetical protein [Eggerthellaceae bacterium]